MSKFVRQGDNTLTGNNTFTGTNTFSGATTLSGGVTFNDDVTLGAGDDLIGSSTSNITFNTDKFTVAGATGNTVVAGTLNVTGLITATAGVTGDLTGDLTPATEAAEHGAGSIGTAFPPVTRRWIEAGVIITQIKFDLTGLASVATANDVIGLAAGGAAFIGRNVVANNGIIFKTQFACIETPAGGDNDVNVVLSSTNNLAYDSAGGTTYISNSGDLLAGQTIENLVPAITANDYFYLTSGTGDTAATYTAGMYVLTLWGHALLA